MKVDESHYKLHWEFFQSTNPKADERFFVELQINKLDKRIKQGLKKVDFSNDRSDTVESYLNDLKRKGFFFDKEYKEFLKAKLIELETKQNLRVLPPLENSIIVHYGCSNFNSNEHKVYWIGAISHAPNKTYFFENINEIETIEKFNQYIQDNKQKTFIHWSMNSPKFGFTAIERRYFDLTNIKLNSKNEIEFKPKNEIDLSEYLKNKYGINYIERQNGRLNNIAKHNSFSGLQSDIEVININDATNRLELLFSIAQAELQGNLKTNSIKKTQPHQNEKPKPELIINQIALIYVYSNKQVTRQNGNNIAKDYGHNSGEKLFQRFTYYSSATNRKGKPTFCTSKKLSNKIKLIKSIIKLLPTEKQQRAIDEVSILTIIYENEYQ